MKKSPPMTSMEVPPTRNRQLKYQDPQRQAKKSRRRSQDLRRLSHEFINQLTVINLSCFRIRGVAAAASVPAVMAELERMERAVAEITELLANLPAEDEASSKISPTDPALGAKVYPLFSSNRRER